MKARLIYSIGFALIVLVEIAIAISTAGGTFVRDSLGDLLVIVLIYCFLRAVLNLPATQTAGISIAIGFLAELLQYIHLAEILGFKEGQLLYIVIGNTFSLLDLLMYLIGGVLAWAIDTYVIIPRLNR